MSGKIALVVLPPDPGRKSSHLAVVKHRGGGWYEAQCMGEGKRCKAGECHHTASLCWASSTRPIRQVPR